LERETRKRKGKTLRLRLEKRRELARILDPRTGFSETTSEIEVRIDPLTGACSRINVSRGLRPKQPLSAAATQPTQYKCPFCPENIEGGTPNFPRDLVPAGKIRSGGAIMFPNLFPLASMHGICVFTPEHKLEIGSFLAREIYDGINCCRDFLKLGESRGMPYHFIGWNHLPPAGASILHPHVQALLSDRPLESLKASANASESYLKKECRIFWEDLTSLERGGPRFVGDSQGFVWIAPWAPTGSYEIQGISTGRSSLLQLDNEEVQGLADGVEKVLKGLSSLGVASLNMGILSLPDGDDFYRLNLRIMGRPSGGISDRALLELYGGEVGITTLPEDYAKAIRF